MSPTGSPIHNGARLQLQPIFPEPITVPGNVARIPYRDRVRFVRRVVVGQAMVVAFLGLLPITVGLPGPKVDLLVLVIGLLSLSLVRAVLRTGSLESVLSWIAMIPTGVGLAGLAQSAQSHGFPVWLWALPSVLAGVYALACGHDFSYTGMASLGVAASAVVLIMAFALGRVGATQAWVAFGWSLVCLVYLAYDVSMIVKRRRPGEEATAVADLFRDTVNWTTYPVRVAAHWRKFRFF